MIPPHTETHLQRGDCVAFGYKGDTKPRPGSHVENPCTPIKLVVNNIVYHEYLVYLIVLALSN